MNNLVLLKLLRRFALSMGVLYVVFIILSFLLINWEETWNKAKLKTLNRVRPEEIHEILTDAYGQDSGLTPKQLDRHQYYYHKVTKYIPVLAEAPLLEAYLYLRGNQPQKAIDLIKHSLTINPSIMWSHYNLGVAYYFTQQYELARESFLKVLSLNPVLTLQMMSSSKIYFPFILSVDDPEQRIKQGLQNAYRQASLLLTATQLQLKEYGETMASADRFRMTFPQDQAYYFMFMAEAQRNMGQNKHAAALYKQSIEAGLTNEINFLGLSDSLEALGFGEASHKIRNQAPKDPMTKMDIYFPEIKGFPQVF